MLKDEILDNYISIIFRKYLGKWDYIDVRSIVKDRTGLAVKIGIAIRFAKMSKGDQVLPRYKDGYLYFYKWEEKDWTYGLLKISSRGDQAIIKATYLLVAMGLKPKDLAIILAKPKVIAVRPLDEDLKELGMIDKREVILQRLRRKFEAEDTVLMDSNGRKYRHLLSEFYM